MDNKNKNKTPEGTQNDAAAEIVQPVDLSKMSPEELLAYAQKMQAERAEQDGVVNELTKSLENANKQLEKADLPPCVELKKGTYNINLKGKTSCMINGVAKMLTAEIIAGDKEIAQALVDKGVEYMELQEEEA